MRISSFLIALLFAVATYGFWAALNRPTPEMPWPAHVHGFAFSPYRVDQSPLKNEFPTEEQIIEDIDLLTGKTLSIRTYSAAGTLHEIPRLAAERKLNVVLGAWLTRDPVVDEQEVKTVIELAKKHRNVKHVTVGNEMILRGDMTPEELGALLDRVRKAVKQPVSTAEPWNVWLAHPELAKHVDFLAVHILPYWEGMDVEIAVDHVFAVVQRLRKEFPKKEIVVAEVGWPSDGRTRESAVASPANEALFLRRFLHRAEKEGLVYYLMEAFDQPWKANSLEGAVGSYWGVYDVERQQKFDFVQPIVRMPEWHRLAGISVILSLILLAFFSRDSAGLKKRGHTFLALVVYAAATVAVWIVYDYSQQYLTPVSLLVGALLLLGMLGVIMILLIEAHEWAEAHWFTARRRVLKPSAAVALPGVSIHVPAYNEPPDMLIETLDALSRLDYPDFEVIVVDNNTRDEAVWRPVERHCALLGPRFRFFHVDRLAGFKAGALNFALRETHPGAAIVAVIDSDYKVEPGWLRDLVPAFVNPSMAIVQAPQDYRDGRDSAFKAMCYAEYKGFFEIGMITRNERNAIIQHGTMTLVRRSVLDRLGGWSEWCITEDAELGLRIFAAGHEALYLPQSYGRGLMPDTFTDYKKQRFRWVYGAMRIMRRHADDLFTFGGTRLTPGQRYHFVAGWLPWIADGVNLVFNLAAIAWSLAMIWAPERVDSPLLMFSVLPLSLFAFKLGKLVHLYTSRVKVNLRQTFAAAMAGLALSHTIGLAVIKGLLTGNEAFFRTPKLRRPSAFLLALNAVRQEMLLLIALCFCAFMVAHIPDEVRGPDLTVWILVLLIQAVPYLASVLVSFISAFPLPAGLLGPDEAAVPAPADMKRV
jgi:exo-beta-1,3-glucanase (GH17 family)/cellulose synthase/poly-beta-1,6-N-acetylglucosamine synthase-like glycosyltransferase